MRSEDIKNDARSVVVSVDAQAKALKKLSEIKDFQVATPEWDWKTVFGFYKPQKINWKLYRVEGPGGIELNPNEKIFESVDKIDPNTKDLKVVLMNKKDSPSKEQNGEVGTEKGKKGGAKAKAVAVKLPRTKQQARRSTTTSAPVVSTPKTPRPKSSLKQNGKDGLKTPDNKKKQTSDAGVQSPRPNGSGSTPSSAKKSKTPKTPKVESKAAGGTTPKNKPEGTSEKGTSVVGLPKKQEVPMVGLLLGPPATAAPPVAGSGPTTGPLPSKPRKRKDAGDAGGGPPAKKAAGKPKPKMGDGPAAGDRISPPLKNLNQGAPNKKTGKKKANEVGKIGGAGGPSSFAVGTGAIIPIPSATSSIAERFALISKDTSLPINRPNTGKSPGNKKPVGASGVQGIMSRFNGYVDPSVAAEIVAECKKIKENPETRNFMRQRAAYIYNMIMHVFLNE